MILAVLEKKRAGFGKAPKEDVFFLNITGGISVDDPTDGLAVVAAIYPLE
jgi:predicted ATP-dependent serine protease